MLYESKIKYLEYRVDGERIKGAGFAKIQRREELCDIRISVTGLPVEDPVTGGTVDSLSGKVFLGNQKKEVECASINVERGKGFLELLSMNATNLKGSNISYEDLSVIRIILSGNGEIVCRIREETVETRVREKETRVREKETRVLENETRDIQDGKFQIHEKPALETESIELEKSEEPNDVKYCSEKQDRNLLQESKWKQLWSIYPHLRPFEDEREYLSVKPEDFVILSEKDYTLIHNSFLLHGYYNYKHLLLQRVVRGGEPFYYLGVPGNFYEREKQVAIMYGFEQFEGLEEAAGNGDYGYYMIPVTL